MREPDQDKLNAFLGRMVGDLGAIASGALALLGDHFRCAAERPFNMIFEARP